MGRGRVDSGEGAIASGTPSNARWGPHTQADEDLIHCNISFGDASLDISSVRRPRGERVRGSTPFVVSSDINHTEWGSVGDNDLQSKLWSRFHEAFAKGCSV